MDSSLVVALTIGWSGVIGNALAILVVVSILGATLRGMRMPFKKKLRARRAKERKAKRRKDLLVESVRTHLLPALMQRGFEAAPLVHDDPAERKSIGTFPIGLLRRARADGGVDLVEIQFMTYQRAAFRINSCAVPKEGMMTAAGPRTAEELFAGGLHDHFETHARPWLRPGLRALRVEPLGEWFSVWRWPLRSPKQAAYDKLAMRVVGILPELDLALREGKLGPHIRRLEFKPLPPEVLERIQRLRSESERASKPGSSD
jgi:hypothetical protein